MTLTEEQIRILQGKTCPYCQADSVMADSAEVYGRSYGPIWICRPCGAYVGCHKGTTRPLGRLANAQLRKLKVQAHDAFDKLWRKRYMTRTDAYAWLSKELEIPSDYTHIGMFSEATCQKVIDLCTKFIQQNLVRP